MACPSLERLTLLSISGLKHLRIRASNLKCLLVDYGYKELHIKDGGNLMVVTVATTYLEREQQVAAVNWRTIFRSLCGLNSLTNLGLSGGLIKLMAADYAPGIRPLRSSSLTSIYLHGLRFVNVEVFSVCLSFLHCCPNLEKFRFSVASAKGSKLIISFLIENQGKFLFPNLRSVQMRYVSGMGSALDFIEFVGARSPNLREVIIVKDGRMDLSISRINGIFARLRRSCPVARIEYLPAGPNSVV